MLLNPTDGSSFTGTQVQSQQVASSRLRAIETGRWVLQAAPTGFSAVVAPDGRVLQRTGVSERAVLHAAVTLPAGRTWAVTMGDWLAVSMSGALVAAGWVLARRITLDDDDVAAAGPSASASTTAGGNRPVMPLLIEVWLRDDGAVVRMAVRPTRPVGSTSEPEGGWTLDFRPGRSFPPEEPDNVTPIFQVEVGTLRGPYGVAACDVPL